MSRAIVHRMPPVDGEAGATTAPRRRTPPSARGGPMLWLMSLCLAISLAMVVGLLALIAFRGMRTFWPRDVDRLTLRDGSVVLGVQVDESAFEPSEAERERLEGLIASGEVEPWQVGPDGMALRRLYRVGNRELGQEGFRWISLHEVESIGQPAEAALIERRDWGVWLGTVEGFELHRTRPLDGAADGGNEAARVEVETEFGPGVAERRVVRDLSGNADVVERIALADPALLPLMLEQAEQRRKAIALVRDVERSAIDREIADANLQLETVRYRHARPTRDGIGAAFAVGLAAAAIGLFVLGRVLGRGSALGSSAADRGRAIVARLCPVVGVMVVAFVLLEWAMVPAALDDVELAAAEAAHAERLAELNERATEIDGRLQALVADDARYRILLRDPLTGRVAPREQNQPEEPIPVSRVVRVVQPNELGMTGKLGVYLERWWEFLSTEPRDANKEGGVWPVIVGTVVLTMLLTVSVLPLGVLAAVYLREYARQGVVVSLVRIAVNNLAGVPSIVYGVFGLGFFCYTVGGFVDRGPSVAARPMPWWIAFAGLGVVVWVVMSASLWARWSTNERKPRVARLLRSGVVLGWIGAAVFAGVLIATSPYFDGFFPVQSSGAQPVFGGRGVLWASLTLALLTLPVVIVATEEAIAAVPNSLREGSAGCGASKWQTVRRIVLPGAMPGILTGAILAVARGAGEVAPLMLVGAVKLAPELPVSGEFPYLHAERSFMHLGFHIYDLGFQSSDATASRPLVWTTTLLLIMIVLVLNLAAIVLRARLRRTTGAAL